MGKWVEWCWESPLMEDGWTQGYMLSWLTAVGEPTLGSVWARRKKKRENNWKNSCLVVLRQEWCIWPASPQLCATAHDTLQSNPLAYRHFLEFLKFTAHHPVLTLLLLTFNKCCCLMLQQLDGLFKLNLAVLRESSAASMWAGAPLVMMQDFLCIWKTIGYPQWPQYGQRRRKAPTRSQSW